jgi:type I restriction enzyme M protein
MGDNRCPDVVGNRPLTLSELESHLWEAANILQEAEMRRKLIEADLIECVLDLGPNIFYNSPMEACVVICRTNKPKERRGKILFINAVNEVTRKRGQSFLNDSHIEHIVQAYKQFKDEPNFAYVAAYEEIQCRNYNMSIPLYIANPSNSAMDSMTIQANISKFGRG